MKYLCTACNYIYDEAVWDPKEEIPAWTLFKEFPYDFSCPNCFEPKDSFMEIKEEILYVQNKNFMTPLEKTHIPKINIFDWKVFVDIWKVEHPMVEWHFIYSVSLYDEYWDLVEEKLLNIWDKPKVEFDISDIDDFEIRVKCNIDWLWSSWIIKNN